MNAEEAHTVYGWEDVTNVPGLALPTFRHQNHGIASAPKYSCNGFIQLLSYKAESFWFENKKADARDTPKTCSDCGSVQVLETFKYFDKYIYLIQKV
jgi:hypothetical protein